MLEMHMRKLILIGLMAATAIPGAASAQDRHVRTEVRQEVRQDVRRDLRHDRQRVRVAYVAPVRGWRYRSIHPGFQLQSSFYGSRYYISDYGAYQLRAPNRWQRWIRYGDDLVLVNVRTGRVIQVIRGRY
jgi:Ni/Co efflux regulator RcnB